MRAGDGGRTVDARASNCAITLRDRDRSCGQIGEDLWQRMTARATHEDQATADRHVGVAQMVDVVQEPVYESFDGSARDLRRRGVVADATQRCSGVGAASTA